MHGSESHGTNKDGFAELADAESRQFLRDGEVGILGVSIEGEIELRPVNYQVYRETLVIRTDRGILFEAASQGQAASLAVVSANADERSASSVIAKGRLRHGDAALHGVNLASWAHEGKSERILLEIESVSGRRLAARRHEG